MLLFKINRMELSTVGFKWLVEHFLLLLTLDLESVKVDLIDQRLKNFSPPCVCFGRPVGGVVGNRITVLCLRQNQIGKSHTNRFVIEVTSDDDGESWQSNEVRLKEPFLLSERLATQGKGEIGKITLLLSSRPNGNIDIVPDDNFLEICRYLALPDIIMFSYVCKRWNGIIQPYIRTSVEAKQLFHKFQFHLKQYVSIVAYDTVHEGVGSFYKSCMSAPHSSGHSLCLPRYGETQEKAKKIHEPEAFEGIQFEDFYHQSVPISLTVAKGSYNLLELADKVEFCDKKDDLQTHMVSWQRSDLLSSAKIALFVVSIEDPNSWIEDMKKKWLVLLFNFYYGKGALELKNGNETEFIICGFSTKPIINKNSQLEKFVKALQIKYIEAVGDFNDVIPRCLTWYLENKHCKIQFESVKQVCDDHRKCAFQ